MDFTNLTAVSEQLYVWGINKPPSTDSSSGYNEYSYTWVDYAPYEGVDIVFPALRSAMSIGLWGNISRLVFLQPGKHLLNQNSLIMPNLQIAALPSTANPGDYPFFTGIVIQSFGSALDVNLPTLSNADGIKLEGNLSR